MGRCITVIKLVGASSLGLLTASLTYQSFQAIPDLIRRLNNQVSLSAASATAVINDAVMALACSHVANVVFATLSSALLATAYRYSPPSQKHPYLLYSAFGAPLALVSLYYKGLRAECNISKRSAARRARLAKGKAKPAADVRAARPVEPRAEESKESDLDRSYIHVSDESLATTTPASSAPGSPEIAAETVAEVVAETVESIAGSSIEDEVADALSKKEYVADLETVSRAYAVASSVAGAGLAVCTVGFVGDYFFL